MSDVTALLNERESYVRRGLKARVAQVDAVLASMGIGVGDSPPCEAAVEAAPETAMQAAPVKPKTRGR